MPCFEKRYRLLLNPNKCSRLKACFLEALIYDSSFFASIPDVTRAKCYVLDLNWVFNMVSSLRIKLCSKWFIEYIVSD